MKNRLSIFPILFMIASCGDDTPDRSFELTISSDRGANEILYVLNEKSLNVYRVTPDSMENDTAFIFQSALAANDTLGLIALLDAKSFSCKEQHALDANHVSFSIDTTKVNVNPDVNHPAELDYAVRLINSIVSDDLELIFLDMQPAIEPDGKLRL